ncbi:hypothetical protein ABID31_002760 [Chryseobacterium flavum]|uniref:hypothetical protein n=1 Tax=Chryseobacterium flavum TaxID=415851 RepID=UPI0013004F01|nr:hypothetical protein [Chryseobacterium flavum]
MLKEIILAPVIKSSMLSVKIFPKTDIIINMTEKWLLTLIKMINAHRISREGIK